MVTAGGCVVEFADGTVRRYSTLQLFLVDATITANEIEAVAKRGQLVFDDEVLCN